MSVAQSKSERERQKKTIFLTCFYCCRTTRSVFVMLKCVKFISDRGSALDLLGSSRRSSRPLSGLGKGLPSPHFSSYSTPTASCSRRLDLFAPWNKLCGHPWPTMRGKAHLTGIILLQNATRSFHRWNHAGERSHWRKASTDRKQFRRRNCIRPRAPTDNRTAEHCL